MNEITIKNLSKRHRQKTILQGLSFIAQPGKITAFLGPNGAGKSSTLRILLGLDAPSSGTALFDGKNYRHLDNPLQTVGAVFDGLGGLPSRKIATHLRIIALSNQLPKQRIDEVLKMTQLYEKRHARLGTLSLGEGQRLGLACALLGDPQFLVLDEPTNGLDPLGMRWFKRFIRQQADLGKTILLSSHFLAEVEEIADEVVVIHQGEIRAAGPLSLVMKDLTSLEDVFFTLMQEDQSDENF
ncbi:ABC transporter [Enterococcus sp. JM4C]|uniref:ABC transporter ATP-binding protein n=1 Tax=Candidatus Enterococcus huntleyi TaxID=1857217 RepID=UPI00137B1A0F|nr:ATP-binding cassette domain-containing protein [Enterococcus sp. JM4C]KAF1297218.1 ABC transporter [Enterococcus sp. JM4C]